MPSFQENIRHIKEKVKIEEIIGEYISLTKRGNNFVGLCPFHDDKNPSLSVSPKRQYFKCFSCNESGDVFTFLEKYLHVTPMEAIRQVAKKCNIEIALSEREKLRQHNKKYYKILKDATAFYEFCLNGTKLGEEARAYLEKRGINDSIIKRFMIGCSVDGDSLTKMLLDKGHLEIDINEVNLLRYHNDTKVEVFQNRVMFPLKNLDGDIVGFSGRTFRESDKYLPKYLNTEETVVFQKGEILYNYYDALKSIKAKKEVILLEGYMDVIAFYKAGIENAVASMGTSLTANQALQLKKISNRVIIAYDGDEPGQAAIRRAIPILREAGIKDIGVLLWPDNLDPDDFLKSKGTKAFQEFYQNGQISDLDFLYNFYKKAANFSSVNSLEHFKTNIFELANSYNSSLVTEVLLKKLSSDLELDLTLLREDFLKNQKEFNVTDNLHKKTARKEVIENKIAEKIKRQNREAYTKRFQDLLIYLYEKNDDTVKEYLNIIKKWVFFDSNLLNIYSFIYLYYREYKKLISRALLENKLKETGKFGTLEYLQKLLDNTKLKYFDNSPEEFKKACEYHYIKSCANDNSNSKNISLDDVLCRYDTISKLTKATEKTEKEELEGAFESDANKSAR